MPAFFKILTRFRKDERGVFGVIFAVLAVVLVAAAGCVVDFAYTQTTRSRAQTALDATALALQAKMATMSEDQLKTAAHDLVVERLADSTITVTITGATKNVSAGTLDLSGNVKVPTTFVQLVGVKSITANLFTEVTQSSSNLEVSLALDLTQSMTEATSGGWNAISKINALKDSTHMMINLLVQNSQPPAAPSYTRMAFAPYSYGVNVTDYMNKVRGATTSLSGTYTGGSWSAGSSKTISSISKNSPYTVTTSANHGLATGDSVYISGVTANGMSGANGIHTITNTGNKTFKIDGFSPGNNPSNALAGSVIKCASANCDVTLSGVSAGFQTGDGVLVSNANGYTSIDDDEFFVTMVNGTSMTLLGSAAANGSTASTVNGHLTREDYGDARELYTSSGGSVRSVPANPNCVTERTINPHQFDDAAPGTGGTPTLPVGFMYTSSSSNCVGSKIVPLTDDKTALSDAVDDFDATGSTAGHIGLAWAWYLLSPNFNFLFDNDSDTPTKTYSGAAYGTTRLIKAVVLMTDGEFNTAYCKGIISSSTNCAAPDNGDSISQAQAICTKIKASGGPDHKTQLFTVGLGIGTLASPGGTANQNAQSFLSGCATDSSKTFYLAQTAADLNNAFTDIAHSLSDLRLSK